ncbi:PREDICTED: uncharacterized protein LOC104825834 isoform X2 [Tarenaya hassleriana]|uniref:uncharacterized protein LOC104825834 isoform X2 n=1 Tax=Tarenaya hassleriana TaxID=28532 RepID=UPI00053C9325|nr:PREDICTED: uncharacterized protein LOC104825834 isoform X2 [Tarenaya hassleriana]
MQRRSPKQTSALRKSQSKKPSQRKTSPVGWFPRKKVDSYLDRKIKKLQEVDGMNQTLDETLGDSNPHYCRIVREQMAVREAACKAMEARKAALVEASWCRILRAARIPCKEAETLMSNTEKAAAEAFEAASAMGVIMYDKPNSSRKRCQIETSSGHGGGSPTHTVTASFETAFDVDKEVAAAVKAAFARLANRPSFSKDEFKELLKKISENPDVHENHEISEVSSECETESDFEPDTLHKSGEAEAECQKTSSSYLEMRQLKAKRRQSFGKLNREKLVDMMFERLRGLHEDELSSLATIVATCGLNAALAEVGHLRLQNLNPETSVSAHELLGKMSSTDRGSSRDSNFESFMEGKTPKKPSESEIPSLEKFLVKRMTKLEKVVHQAKMMAAMDAAPKEDKNPVNEARPEPEVPSLDKVLVKHMTKLEREVFEAKIASKDVKGNPDKVASHENIPDLGSVLVKNSSRFEREIAEAKKNAGTNFGEYRKISSRNHLPSSEPVPDLESLLVKKHCSRLEKEIEETKKNSGKMYENIKKPVKCRTEAAEPEVLPSLENIVVKHVSKLEKEVQEAKKKSKADLESRNSRKMGGESGKENVDSNNDISRRSETEDTKSESPVHRLERERMMKTLDESRTNYGNRRNKAAKNETELESLDKVLVKHVSRLEKEKMRFLHQADERVIQYKKEEEKKETTTNKEGSLDQILLTKQHKTRLDREKIAAAAAAETEQSGEQTKQWLTRRQARDREMQEAWGGLDLGNSIRPRLSKLEREKAAWIKAEEEERRKAMNGI